MDLKDNKIVEVVGKGILLDFNVDSVIAELIRQGENNKTIAKKLNVDDKTLYNKAKEAGTTMAKFRHEVLHNDNHIEHILVNEIYERALDRRDRDSAKLLMFLLNRIDNNKSIGSDDTKIIFISDKYDEE